MKQNKVFTIPNLLSVFRLLLIPVIVWLYRREQNHFLALLVLMLSGATDLADGYIARKWDLVSDLGKALDPIADKLTQIATLWCLLERFPHMCLPLAVLTVKEVFTGTMSLYAVKKSGQVIGADWHGKVCTAFLYGAMGLHMLWPRIPVMLSQSLMILSTFWMCLSGMLYWYRNYKQIKGYL